MIIKRLPEVSQLDELQAYVGKKTKYGYGRWSLKAFQVFLLLLWEIDRKKDLNPYGKLFEARSIFYVTDGYVVYPQFIDEVAHIVSQIYMTRV